MSKKEVYAVIMAGGVGTRFWPMSRSTMPKQFLDILGIGKSLIQMTFDRLTQTIDAKNILVVTNEKYRELVQEHLPAMPNNNILCEPCMRNTAPCIAYANAVIEGRVAADSRDVAIVVAPSDHLIVDSAEFSRVLGVATDVAVNDGALVTLGIKPTRPDTGYGYIKFAGEGETVDVERFTEKPDLSTAESMLAEGGYCWNSGIFIWSLEAIKKEFRQHLPQVEGLFSGKGLCGAKGEADQLYEKSESISIDYGVLEKAARVKVIPSDFGWSDLGTWQSLAGHLNKDENGNCISGAEVVANESGDNVVVSEAGKMVAVKGLDGYIIVDTKDALLICPRTSEQWVKELVGSLKTKT